MPKFMFKAAYNAEGLKGLRKEKASGREKAVIAGCEAHGGKLDAFYYALGDDDVFVIADFPDTVHAAAFATAVAATGALSHARTVALLTVGEMDKALHDSKAFRAPGA